MSDSADKSYWIRKAFHDFDESGEGMLTMEGLKCTITALLGSRPTKYQVNQLFVLYNVERGISEAAFVDVMSKKMALQDQRDEFRQILRAFDVRRRGFLTVEDVTEAFATVCPSLPLHSVLDAFAEVDVDRRGRIGLQQFEWIMQRSRARDYHGRVATTPSQMPTLFSSHALLVPR